MKGFRRWNKILHRDLGYFFVGSTIIYGLSGIALNHRSDWNPSYSIEQSQFMTSLDLRDGAPRETIDQLVADEGREISYKSHYYPKNNIIKIFLQGGSNLVVNTETGSGEGEFMRRRAVFYEVNFLHYNPNAWWKWFSDIYAVALIFFSFSSFFMVQGRKGPLGRGGIYVILGVVIPIIFLIIFS